MSTIIWKSIQGETFNRKQKFNLREHIQSETKNSTWTFRLTMKFLCSNGCHTAMITVVGLESYLFAAGILIWKSGRGVRFDRRRKFIQRNKLILNVFSLIEFLSQTDWHIGKLYSLRDRMVLSFILTITMWMTMASKKFKQRQKIQSGTVKIIWLFVSNCLSCFRMTAVW